jgi:hypothetical protein
MQSSRKGELANHFKNPFKARRLESEKRGKQFRLASLVFEKCNLRQARLYGQRAKALTD